MSIFIDAGIFIAYVNKKDSHHSKATDLIDEIMDNKYGAAFTSNEVFDGGFDGIVTRIGD
jgi:predicted nucleic acid-binding protein